MLGRRRGEGLYWEPDLGRPNDRFDDQAIELGLGFVLRNALAGSQ